MNQNNAPTVMQEGAITSRQPKAPRIVLATTMSAIMVISNPSVASANNATPIRPYGVSGGQGGIELESSQPYKIELESARITKVSQRKKQPHSARQHREKKNSIEDQEVMKKSIYTSSLSEVLFFGHYFGVSPKDPEAFIKKVKNIQKQAGFSKKNQDGIIGPGTLKMLYTKYYKNAKKLPKDIQARQNLIQIANKYHKKGHHMNPYNRGEYLGLSGTMNIPNTYLDAHLYSHLPGERRAKQYQLPMGKKYTPNSILIRRISQEGKYVLALYDTKGNLRVLTYTSPGKNGTRWDKKRNKHISTRTTEGKFRTSGKVIKNYVSKAFEAPMPNALFFNWKSGEAIHGSARTTGRLASHGCTRIPYYYTQGISTYSQGGTSYSVDIRGLYKK